MYTHYLMSHSPSHYRSTMHWLTPPAQPEQPRNPVKLMVLTSVRDVGSCDKNGSSVSTPEGWRYMEGAVERLINESREGGALSGLIEVVGIINDDMEQDMKGSPYPAQPKPYEPWIHLHHLRNESGELIAGENMTHWIPSTFRKVRTADDPAQKAELKTEFERQVAERMRQCNADILLSDHYMARIEHLIAKEHGLYGRVLNIHPAITLADHPYCFRGPTPTQDSIDRAQTDDHTITGATLHLVNSVIDDGPPIAHMEGTPVYPYDDPQHLRYRNYQQAKLPLLTTGLRHYVEHIFMHMNRHTSQLTPQ
ncbi:hypothetical protein COU78_01215 [Candidatus Peregrinibacteria bacterium CG10_big_fil_rev_8_21_14_0_10_49_24]|nr:MAG: hypothetical protein COV83_04180 [Candidatus Peregrinibacteria bacterium CG11_big_fil_rev_8_21_14_0_20_49_14]PIR51346.1 MAG: hypothetical protein COU78_01215 [Candidatus Peregrinibacteria bacterium CG10_big_fil_rev_8_21_14_0_10_49_24]PJA68110.1 MAG: hypothetical protein CO157_01030 [Candidatus Peregrinibacteria bacterium CG_4_9_14_3_um_filter_49_12]